MELLEILRGGGKLAEKLPRDAFSVVAYRLALAQVAVARHRLTEAHAEIDPLLARLQQLGVRTAIVTSALLIRAELTAAEGQLEPSMSGARQALALSQELQGSRKQSLWTGLAWLTLASLQRDGGQVEQAQQSARHALDQLEPILGETHPKVRRAESSWAARTLHAPECWAIERAQELRGAGLSLRAISAQLAAEAFLSPAAKPYCPRRVSLMLRAA